MIKTILPPPSASKNKFNNNFSILNKLSDTYKFWHNLSKQIPKSSRFVLGNRINNILINCLEMTLLAEYAPGYKKLETAIKLSDQIDILKFHLKLLWEIKSIDDKKYLAISLLVNDAGRMTGGWIKQLKNPKGGYQN